MSKLGRLGLTPLQSLFVQAFDGDIAATANRCMIDIREAECWYRSPWFADALIKRTEREARRRSDEQMALMREKIADRAEVQAFWTAILRGDEVPMLDPDTGLPMLDEKGAPKYTQAPSTRDRIAAAKALADSLGMQTGTQAIEVRGAVCVTHTDIEERIKTLGADRRIGSHQPSESWLS